MQDDSGQPNINSWLEDELMQQYNNDRKTVDPSWAKLFESNGGSAKTARTTNGRVAGSGYTNGALHSGSTATAFGAPPASDVKAVNVTAVNMAEIPRVAVSADDQVVHLRGPALRIAENMAASLTIPSPPASA